MLNQFLTKMLGYFKDALMSIAKQIIMLIQIQ